MDPYKNRFQPDLAVPGNLDKLGDGSDISYVYTVNKILNSLSNENENNSILKENALLRQELEGLRTNLTEQKMENLKLKSYIEDPDGNMPNDKEIDDIKKYIIETIRKFLKIQTEEPIGKLKLFESTFSCFLCDSNFMEQMQEFDMQFYQILIKRYKVIFEEEVLKVQRKIQNVEKKRRERMLEHFLCGLRLESWAQDIEIYLSSLKVISELRGIVLKLSTKKDRKPLLLALQNIEQSLDKHPM